jgi:hypothetical protein
LPFHLSAAAPVTVAATAETASAPASATEVNLFIVVLLTVETAGTGPFDAKNAPEPMNGA